MASSRFQIISKKIVKPSSPTPSSLRNFKLSLLDQVTTNRYMPMAFFFSNQHQGNTSQVSSLLEASLSKTLTSYYPFAGKLMNNISINCNDMGATFLEARINCSMSEILKQSNTNVQNMVFPSGLPWSSRHDQHSLVVAQLNHYDCGGKSISLCMSHKIADGHTMCNFINNWAATTRQSSKNPSPQFIGHSILPPIGDQPHIPLMEFKQGKNCITKRYIFDSDKLSQLKAKASTNSGVQDPTRVEVVSALLHKCAMSASMVCSGSFKPSILSSALNMRPLIGPPITQNYAGNLFFFFFVPTTHERDINFSRLVSEIRKAKVQSYEKYKGITTTRLLSASLEMLEHLKEVQGKNDIDEYNCSSLCRYPTYNIDFGWGKPVKMSLGLPQYEKYFLLMDSRNSDGIEAVVNLPEQVMLVFQSDPELLTFASLDASF